MSGTPDRDSSSHNRQFEYTVRHEYCIWRTTMVRNRVAANSLTCTIDKIEELSKLNA